MFRHTAYSLVLILCVALAWFFFVDETARHTDNSKMEKFFAIFNAMNSTPETCKSMDCLLVYPRWNEDLRIAVEKSNFDKSISAETEKYLFDLQKYLESVTQREISITNSDPNIVIFFLNLDVINDLLKSPPNGVSRESLEKTIVPSFEVGACAGTVFARRSGGFDTIEFAIIWAIDGMRGAVLQKCILEELIGALGLLSDPPGLASLFDEENFRIISGQIYPSLETECMLRILYRVPRNELYGTEKRLRDLVGDCDIF